MKKTDNTIAPRNHVALAAMRRTGGGAGAHGRTRKADRRSEKMALKSGRYDY